MQGDLLVHDTAIGLEEVAENSVIAIELSKEKAGKPGRMKLRLFSRVEITDDGREILVVNELDENGEPTPCTGTHDAAAYRGVKVAHFDSDYCARIKRDFSLPKKPDQHAA